MRDTVGIELARRIERDAGEQVVSLLPVTGGDIASSFKLTLESGEILFVKWCAEPTRILWEEKRGLDALATAPSGLRVPRCHTLEEAPTGQYLTMDWLESESPDDRHWTELGRGLAALHRFGDSRFGFESDNFIGRLPQRNSRSEDWCEFFVGKRLMPQADWARKRGLWQPGWAVPFDHLIKRLPDILPRYPKPSLIHGDLWSGNVMPTSQGPAIFDPAVYYGHREVDIAMTLLFGGFPRAFYDSYDDVWPRDEAFSERAEIYNLYHLINHLNHFGTGYAGQVGRVMQRFA